MTMTMKKSLTAKVAMLGLILATPLTASAAISSLNLSNYTVTGTYALPGSAPEASAITYNWDTKTLFVLGDEGDALVEVSKTGAQLSVMTLNNFNDTEGVTYIGNGQFVLTEERLRDAYKLTYTAGGSANRTALAAADLGTTIGNIGIEGISFDPRDGSFLTVKEKDPQGVDKNVISFGTPGGAQGSAAISSLFSPNLGVIDLSDIQVLATVPSLIGGADENNLLIVSQESGRLLEVSRTGTILSSLSLGNLSGNIEGVTIDSDGNIYLAAEASNAIGGSTMFVLSAPSQVPLPASLPLLGSALGGLLVMRRRRAAA
jgi:uncharacterized protein YjiK